MATIGPEPPSTTFSCATIDGMRALLLLVAPALGSAGCHYVFDLAPPTTPTPDAIVPIDRWRLAAAGDGHSCALDDEQRLYCWGRNADGELGRGVAQPMIEDIARVGDARWTKLATFHRHTCGEREDGGLWCWGANASGQLGDGSTEKRLEPVRIADGAWHAIAAGREHTCAIRDDRSLACWGANAAGQLGNGTQLAASTPASIGSGAMWDAIATGGETTCGIQVGGTLVCWGRAQGTDAIELEPTPRADLWKRVAVGGTHACGITSAGQLRCWGDNSTGALGDGTTVTTTTPVSVTIDGVDRADWTDVAAGSDFTCARTADARLWCWGASDRGQAGHDGTPSNPRPLEIGAGTVWTALASGGAHTCAVAADATMWCFGNDGYGQLGDGGASPRVPELVDGNYSAISAGLHHTCAVTSNGEAHCAGLSGGFARLGNGTRTSQRRFTALGTLGWTAISAGDFHSCGIRDGDAYCWGANYAGHLGIGTSGPAEPSPVRVMPAAVVVARSEHTCALAADGTASCWGNNAYGQLGTGTTDAADEPQPVTAVGPMIAIQPGESHTCGISAANVAYCWGYGLDGRLGTQQAMPSPMPNPTPLAVSTTNAAHTLAVGHRSTCTIGDTGQAECWGANYGGELGTGDYSSRTTPVPLARTWQAIDIARNHACGIGNGELYCWGTNERGQLGLDSYEAAPTPTRVGDRDDWSAVAVGDQFSCALSDAGMLWCWGDNTYGQHGDGSAWRIEPVQVVAPP